MLLHTSKCFTYLAAILWKGKTENIPKGDRLAVTSTILKRKPQREFKNKLRNVTCILGQMWKNKATHSLEFHFETFKKLVTYGVSKCFQGWHFKQITILSDCKSQGKRLSLRSSNFPRVPSHKRWRWTQGDRGSMFQDNYPSSDFHISIRKKFNGKLLASSEEFLSHLHLTWKAKKWNYIKRIRLC